MELAEKIGLEIYGSKGNSFFEERNLNPRRAQLVKAQTMHDVFYIPGNNIPGAYVKIAKKDKSGTSERREMDTEGIWYNILRNDLKIPGAPIALTFAISNEYALAVEEVPGTATDKLFREIAKERGAEGLAESREFADVLERSAEISARGYLLHRKNPENTPVYFRGADGGFDSGEFDSLNARTIKIMKANGRDVRTLFPLLDIPKTELTAPKNRALYRDATPLNWIFSEEGVVAIDLGSTSYRPPQFELIALIETPKTGIDEINCNTKSKVIERYRKLLVAHELTVSPEEIFNRDYILASFVKNASATASRIEHIAKNNAMIASEDQAQQKLGSERLPRNIEAKRFHAQRAIEAIESLSDYWINVGFSEEAKKQKDLFENELLV